MNYFKRVSAIFAVPLFFVATSACAASQKINGLYVNSFGDPKQQAVIFVHGGPGYNSHDFEVTTAQTLAKEGFFVVVYDQRGQGRSDEAPLSVFTYRQYADDLKKIVDTLGLNKPILIGHSHGGPISLKFDQLYPKTVKKVVLVSAPINFWGSMHSLLDNCARKYTETHQQDKLDSLTYAYYQIALNPSVTSDERIQAVTLAFAHGLGCGLYSVKNPTSSAIALREVLKKNPISGSLAGMTTAMPGFLVNENYITVNLVEFVLANRAHIYGIYGDEDGLFTPLELAVLRNSLQQGGEPVHYQLVSGASHGVFIDQQEQFIKAFKAFAK